MNKSNIKKEKRDENIIKKDVLKRQERYEDFASVRNIKGILNLAIFWNFFFNFLLIALFSYIETVIHRFNKSTMFTIIETVCISVYLLVFYGAKTYIYFFFSKKQKMMLYEHKLVENIKGQFAIDYFLPIPSIIILFVRWTYYIKIGGIDAFNTIQGYFYELLSIVCFMMALLSITIIIISAYSYYRPYIIPSETKLVTNDPWRPEKFFHLTEKRDDDNGKTVRIEYR